MNHTTALRTMAVERYLLEELDPQEKEEFEEHFFCCDECAQDIRTGAVLMENAKAIFEKEKVAEVRTEVAAPAVPVRRPKREWFAWLRPAFAVPVMALMAGVLFFQNLIQLPAMHQEMLLLNSPSVLPGTYLASGSARGDDHVVVAKPGQLFELTIDIPDNRKTAHLAELYDSAGRKQWSLPIPEDAPKEGLSLKMPGDLPAGKYSLEVEAAGAAAADQARYSFTLQRS